MLHRFLAICTFGVSFASGCGGAPSLLDMHWQTLGSIAEGMMECPEAELAPVDDTPETMTPMSGDPETRRYIVTGCEREMAFVCYRVAMAQNNETPECRPLRREGEGSSSGGVYLGPIRVTD